MIFLFIDHSLKIKVSARDTVRDLQSRFSKHFPYLRLAFLKPVGNPLYIPLRQEIQGEERLEAYLKKSEDTLFFIRPKDTVSEVEQNFRLHLSLQVQVLRHSGDSWLITSFTDKYTLEEQNEFGKELDQPVAADEPGDIHEQE